MTAHSALPPVATPTVSDLSPTRTLIAAGLLPGPLFTLVAATQILTRDGFDLRHHPLSALSLGDAGWVQIANFVIAGALSAAFAVGVRRGLRGGPAGTWGPVLLGGYGIGLIAAGLFVTDGAYGFPAGAPAGLPATFSWHAMVHGAAATLAFLSLTAACGVFARRFVTQRRPVWAAASLATGVAVPVLAAWPGTGAASIRLAVATLLAWAWLTALAAQLRADHRTAG
ncbi:DUF998 domain-containing protein [Micromonospora sp. NPDC049048]|uniref:DUF998 domain-containing protein n=1 Tax=Micromonospora sp. NPDC049048 TaxID=3364263 RepID=UPI0037156384